MKKTIFFLSILLLLALSACTQSLNYTINFDSNGGTEVASIETEGITSVTIPDNPTKEGYVFDGWYWDNNTFNQPFSANSLLDTPLSSDMTFYAKWITEETLLDSQLESIYNIALSAGAFVGTYEEWLETVIGPQGISGDEIVLRVYFGNIEWKYDSDSIWNILISLSDLTADVGKEIESTSINNLGELIIKYTDSTQENLGDIITVYSVSFRDFNGYFFDSQIVMYGDDAIAPENPTREGYTFSSWNQSFVDIDSDMIITAQYVINTYSITFDSNGGSAQNSMSTVSYGSTIQLPVPTKEGWHFTGWYLGDSVNNDQFTSSDEVYQDIILYARWEIKTYIVRFYDFDEDLIYVETVNYLNSAQGPIIPMKLGYDIIGWDKKFIEVTSNMDVYSVYSIQLFDIFFDSNGGDSINSQYDVPYDTILNLVMPEKSGYDFLGWSYDSEYYNRYSHITQDLYLEAMWIEDTNLVFELIDGGTYEANNYENINSIPLDIIIPDFYNGLPVTNFDMRGVAVNEFSRSIYLPTYLSHIADGNIYSMGNLENIYISEGNEYFTVLDNVLYTKDMKNLLNYPAQRQGNIFSIPETVERIGFRAFGLNQQIGVINIGRNLRYIDEDPFNDSFQISLVNVDSDNLYFINHEGVLFNKDMTKLYFYPYQREGSEYIVPSTVTELAPWAFVTNYNIESIVLPEGLTTIGVYAFKYNWNLRSLNMPTTVVNMEDLVFDHDCALTIYTDLLSKPASWADEWNKFDVPVVWGYIETIDNGEFIYATSTLGEVSIIGLSDTASNMDIHIPSTIDGDEVVQITSAAFQSTNITSMYIPNTLKVIGPNAFAECISLSEVIFEENSTLETIGMFAFQNNNNLMSIIIPLSVEYMGYRSLGIGDGAIAFLRTSILPSGWREAWSWFNGTCIFGYLQTYDNGEFIYADTTFDEIYILNQSPSSTETEIAIPKIINDKSVVVIASCAFKDNQLITKVFIPNTIEIIHSRAFENAINLETVVFEENSNITQIVNNAFNNCDGLHEIIIPEGTEIIGHHVFYDCDNLSKIMIPNTVVYFESLAMLNQPGATIYVALPSQPSTWDIDWNPSNLPVVWNYTGYYQSTIEFNSNDGTIVSSITQDEGTAVVEPSNPTREGYAFLGWYTEPEFNTEYTFTVIPKNDITLYAKWQALSSTITFDTNDGSAVSPITQTVGTAIESISPPTKAGYTFNGWFTEPELSNQYILTVMPENDLTLYAKWILNTSTINFDSSGGTAVDAITQAEGSAVSSPEDPTKTNAIFNGWYTEPEFSNLYVFDTMPIDDITLYAKWIEPYQVVENEMTYNVIGDEATLISFAGSATEIVIPKTLLGGSHVVAIDNDVFSWSSITSVFIPNTVISIGDAAFYYISSLTTVEFELGSLLVSIGNEAFANDYGMTSFVIPDTVENIGYSAFHNCSGLKDIVIPISVTYIGENAFNDCRNLTLYLESETSVVSFDANWNPDDIPIFYGYIETIDDGDFVYATSTLNIATIIRMSPTNINTDLVILASYGVYLVTSINSRAFQENTQIVSITIPSGVTEIKRSTFDSASNLTTVVFANGSQLEVIGRSAFAWCTSLTTIVLPDTLTTIELEAFYYTTGLTSIIIPLNVINMGEGAFNYSGCSVINVRAAGIPASWNVDWNPSNILVHWGFVD